ncbi:hypothetical protein K438DRAFT_1863996 [Mycena galopus ATCC 62051]|nr:hypothetical protein K438DRAFT_1863996 [Mycena galopus ATCC 62051]
MSQPSRKGGLTSCAVPNSPLEETNFPDHNSIFCTSRKDRVTGCLSLLKYRADQEGSGPRRLRLTPQVFSLLSEVRHKYKSSQTGEGSSFASAFTPSCISQPRCFPYAISTSLSPCLSSASHKLSSPRPLLLALQVAQHWMTPVSPSATTQIPRECCSAHTQHFRARTKMISTALTMTQLAASSQTTMLASAQDRLPCRATAADSRAKIITPP